MDLLLIGAGRVGTAVAVLLQGRGHRVLGIASRSVANAKRSSDLLNNAPVFPLDGGPEADAILLGVPGNALEEVAAQIAGSNQTRIVCHFAGAVGITPLRVLTDRGRLAASLHPVQACPDIGTAIRRLPGSAWGVTTSEQIQDWAEGLIANDLRGFPVVVAEQDRPAWHAAAATVSNGAAALLSLGEAMLTQIGIQAPGAVLGPLIAGTVANAAEAGDAAATLTGPIVRGETDTVRSHIQALSGAPALLEAYRLIARSILVAAIEGNRIDAITAESIRRTLEE